MSETHATTAVFPPGRYGRRRDGRPRRWLPITAAVLFGAGLIGITMQYYDKFGQTDYTADIIGWNEPSDTELVIQFRVQVPEGGTATCMLRARDYDGFEVGRRSVRIPAPAGGGSVEVSESIPTKERGSVGDVMGCRATA
ncbi:MULTISPECIES: DUF4307 domain-containing protein [Actinoplanes]|uniref:DUF4307 domain-containing protein n=1 Tax=Actinoplanes TaxID=1865 RepID=UPI0005F29535|nr:MULTISPECIES: DUF4307 domain-containing protein [Actinoplanes]